MKRNKIYIVLLLIGLICYPTLSQYAHIVTAHDHPTCKQRNVHFHQGETFCVLMDYVSNTPAVLSFSTFETVFPVLYSEAYPFCLLPVFNTPLFSYQKRGPPSVA